MGAVRGSTLMAAGVLWTLSAGLAAAQAQVSGPTLLVDDSGLQWTAVQGATGYDVIRGEVARLQQSGDRFTSAVRVCLADDQPWTFLAYEGVPKVGEAFFFLVRAATGDTADTFDSGGAGQAAPRDAAIDASPRSCFSTVVPRAPIVIGGDNQFTAQRGVVAGTGSIGDPYVIAGWDIECASPTGSTGIEIRHTTAAYVVRNVRVRACGTGILLDRGWNGRVERSRLESDLEGIRVSESGQMAIEGNRLDGVAGAAIRFDEGSSGGIVRNSITGCGMGVDLDGAGSVVVYANNFNGNVTQALDRNGSASVWHTAYPQDWSSPLPLGGNYWSDYGGADQCSGENQNLCPGRSDGFGDQPLAVPTAGIDLYPRMTPASDEGDTLPPTIVMSAPADRFTPSVDVTGEAHDAGTGVSQVKVRVNGGPWAGAGPPGSWSFHANLVPGSNVIEAQALDRAGNTSAIARTSVMYHTPPVWQAVLETSQASYAPGADVPFTVRVTHDSTAAATLTFPSTCEAFFTVTSQGGQGLYDHLQHVGCFFVFIQRTVPAGGAVVYSFTWRQTDDLGNQVPFPASYTLRAIVDDDVVPQATKVISIGP